MPLAFMLNRPLLMCKAIANDLIPAIRLRILVSASELHILEISMKCHLRVCKVIVNVILPAIKLGLLATKLDSFLLVCKAIFNVLPLPLNCVYSGHQSESFSACAQGHCQA
jgi:hypothetical protein